MAFTIKLQTTSSMNNKIGKTIDDIMEMRGTLKNGTSVIDPVILIDSDAITDDSVFQANYCTIGQFHRKYFITDIRSIRNGIIELSMHVDVLETYKNEILALNAIIRRTSDSDYFNLYLDDGVFNVYQNPNIITKMFPSGFSGESIILAVAGS